MAFSGTVLLLLYCVSKDGSSIITSVYVSSLMNSDHQNHHQPQGLGPLACSDHLVMRIDLSISSVAVFLSGGN